MYLGNQSPGQWETLKARRNGISNDQGLLKVLCMEMTSASGLCRVVLCEEANQDGLGWPAESPMDICSPACAMREDASRGTGRLTLLGLPT